MSWSSTSKLPSPETRPYYVALGVDEHERGPGVDAVAAPDLAVGVVDDGMLDLVAEDGLADALGLLLVVELGRVDADDDEDAGILGFELGEVGERVDAVDAAEGPEVEQDDAALEIVELERIGGVEPGDAAVELRRLRAGLGFAAVDGAGPRPESRDSVKTPMASAMRAGCQARIHAEGASQRSRDRILCQRFMPVTPGARESP